MASGTVEHNHTADKYMESRTNIYHELDQTESSKKVALSKLP